MTQPLGISKAAAPGLRRTKCCPACRSRSGPAQRIDWASSWALRHRAGWYPDRNRRGHSGFIFGFPRFPSVAPPRRRAVVSLTLYRSRSSVPQKINLAQFGLGPSASNDQLRREGVVELVGGIDIDPAKGSARARRVGGMPRLNSAKVLVRSRSCAGQSRSRASYGGVEAEAATSRSSRWPSAALRGVSARVKTPCPQIPPSLNALRIDAICKKTTRASWERRSIRLCPGRAAGGHDGCRGR